MLLLWLLLQTEAFAAGEDQAERLARLETQVFYLSAGVNRIEDKVDALHGKEEGHTFQEHGLEGLLAAIIMLDKAGYYIRRRRNGKTPEKEES